MDAVGWGYQTEKWGNPAQIQVKILPVSEGIAGQVPNDKKMDGDFVWVEATLLDADGVPCLDARNYLEFSLAGDGNLLDNQGYSAGSHKLQAYNGRAQIKVKLNGSDTNVVVVKSPKINSKVAMITHYQ
ncbi:hypothetical protein [Candidatus Symbiothrix dinenymphae]|uniref:hypothetical protein n=1 Tax=Candidatus Symbiothrix dinenymphae TaxID=467085 RepID=UPI0006C6D80B|nr:hypothetical protein [Candidatus Symbiothrix dinenymphae]GAP72477.1 beta-galactosidase [Candidatus Symbiothrix dinenymphae]